METETVTIYKMENILADTLEEYLNQNKKIWDEKVEALARHLCEQKGIEPDKQYSIAIKYWEIFKEDAEQYHRRRVLNKYFWENLAGNSPWE